jgi:hypothetical protein
MVSYELKSKTSVIARQTASEAQPGSSYAQDYDDAQLQRMGKKPVLKVSSFTVKTVIITFLFLFLLLLLLLYS